mmetsp:Transcript_24265/g.49157  ORF Transcript_24265/g.49157 Transcript_24265/m.49157 type:complete len:205 (-) Transcript_24265:566-1180(-)
MSPGAHDQHLVKQLEHLGRRLEEGDDGGRLQRVARPFDGLDDVVGGCGVEARAHLVHAQHHLRPHQHLRRRNPLFLSARHPAQEAVADDGILAIVEAEDVEHRLDFRPVLADLHGIDVHVLGLRTHEVSDLAVERKIHRLLHRKHRSVVVGLRDIRCHSREKCRIDFHTVEAQLPFHPSVDRLVKPPANILQEAALPTRRGAKH